MVLAWHGSRLRLCVLALYLSPALIILSFTCTHKQTCLRFCVLTLYLYIYHPLIFLSFTCTQKIPCTLFHDGCVIFFVDFFFFNISSKFYYVLLIHVQFFKCCWPVYFTCSGVKLKFQYWFSKTFQVKSRHFLLNNGWW